MKNFIAYPHCIIVGLVALTLLSGCFFETSPVPKGNQSATNNSATNNSPKTPQANSPKVFKSAQIRLFSPTQWRSRELCYGCGNQSVCRSNGPEADRDFGSRINRQAGGMFSRRRFKFKIASCRRMGGVRRNRFYWRRLNRGNSKI